MRVLHVDSNHPILAQGLEDLGCSNEFDYEGSKEEILSKIDQYDGLIIRSRFTIDKEFIDRATKLKFIGRVGAGLENIYIDYAQAKGIVPIAAPEGNRGAVGEHSLGLLLNLLNKIQIADQEVRSGLWKREANRGVELDGKCVGLIGYGNMGKSFAKRLRGFDCEVIFYDLQQGIGDHNAEQVSLEELQEKADILSLHTPETPLTKGMINAAFLSAFAKPIYLINTARGSAIRTSDLMDALDSGKVLGAGLDVLEFEKKSFENFFSDRDMPEAFKKLIQSDKVILTPHVAGWTQESKIKLAQTIVNKVAAMFFNQKSASQTSKEGTSGIGGVYFKAKNPEKLNAWYREALQMEMDQSGVTFVWEDKQGRPGTTKWSLLGIHSNYIEPSEKEFIINYRVDNLQATLDKLSAMGTKPLGEIQQFNYGLFAWVMDPEGNKVELWQPNHKVFL